MQHETILKFFAKYVETELGIVYAEHNYFQLQNRLEEIAQLIGAGTIEELYKQAQSGIHGQFKQLLLDVATNNETSFFRDMTIFRAIEKLVLAQPQQFVRPGEPLRIWSAASSTGQEALSLAMLITEYNKKMNAHIDFSIFGSDISERALDRARKAVYTQLEVQRGLPAPYLIRYFKKDSEDRWTASPELTKHTKFKSINLKSQFVFSDNFHAVFCRNVLIYQSVQGKIDILNRIAGTLVPNGLLVLGAGESLIGLSSDFEQQTVEGALVYRKKSALARAA